MSKLGRAILGAIAVKLEVETHKKYRSVLSKIFGLAFVGFLGWGLYNSIDRYSLAKDINSNLGHIEAEVNELEYDSEKDSMYSYSFMVNDTPYEKTFVTDWGSFSDGDMIPVVYNQSNPTQFERAEFLERNDGIWAIVKYFAMMFFFGGLAFTVVYGFFTYGIVQPTEDYDDDEDLEPESSNE